MGRGFEIWVFDVSYQITDRYLPLRLLGFRVAGFMAYCVVYSVTKVIETTELFCRGVSQKIVRTVSFQILPKLQSDSENSENSMFGGLKVSITLSYFS